MVKQKSWSFGKYCIPFISIISTSTWARLKIRFTYQLFGYKYNPPHIYIYIYIYIYMCVCVCVCVGIRYPDEPLRRNYSRLVPDSLSNYRYDFALLSIEHFLHCSLTALTVVFFFWPTNCVSFDFFQLVWQGWPFLFFFFFPKIYFLPLDSDSLYIFIFKSLAGFFSYHKGYYLI